MKKALVLLALSLTSLPLLAADFQRLNIAGYRIGDSEIMANDDHRIVATNCNGDVKTDLIALTDNRLSSNAWFFASVPKGEEVIRWVAYNNDPAVRPPSDTNNFAGAVTEYVWSYNPTDTADRYVVVDYDYISYTLKYDGNGGSGSPMMRSGQPSASICPNSKSYFPFDPQSGGCFGLPFFQERSLVFAANSKVDM